MFEALARNVGAAFGDALRPLFALLNLWIIRSLLKTYLVLLLGMYITFKMFVSILGFDLVLSPGLYAFFLVALAITVSLEIGVRVPSVKEWLVSILSGRAFNRPACKEMS